MLHGWFVCSIYLGWCGFILGVDSNNVSVHRAEDTDGSGKKRVREHGESGNPVINFGSPSGGSPSIFERVSSGIKDLFTGGSIAVPSVVKSSVSNVSRTLGVSSRTAGIMVCLAMVSVLGLGGFAVVNLVNGNGGAYMGTVFVDDDECVDYLSEAKKTAGGEEVEIPETITGSDGVTYHVGYVGSWEGRVGPLRELNLTGDVLKMANFYDANGGHTDSAGFERIGDLYIVAVGQGPFVAQGQKQTHVGDLLTLTFDDGTSIVALVGDMKGRYGVSDPYDSSTFNTIITGVDPQGRPDTSCGWGHAYDGQVHVLEFWGYGSGEPMSGPLQQSTGGTMRRIASITNHGLAAEFAQFPPTSGAVDGSLVSMNSIKAGKAASTLAECETHGRFDNSSLVSALVSYSYSQARRQPDSEPSTALYQEVCEAVLGTGDCTYSMHYHSCDRGVAAAVRWTGADINFPPGDCEAQYDYCVSHPELWERVTPNDVPITGNDDFAESIGLEPGDIGISRGEHTLAYVGHEAIVEGYENFIKGNDGQTPGTGGDIGEPDPNSAWVMASYGERGAGIQTMFDNRVYAFFRYKGDYPDADKYATVGTSASISGTSSRGTSCDCGEEPEECNNSGAAEIIAQVAERIASDDSHGYSQDNREGDGTSQKLKLEHEVVSIHGGDYDCSSLVAQCCVAARLMFPGNTFSTASEDAALTAAGFTRMDFSPSAVRRGDILWHQGHTGVALGNSMQADAKYDEDGGTHGTKVGDQTGDEISKVGLWEDYWTYIYRPPSKGGNAQCADKISGKGSLTDEQRKKIIEFAISQIGVAYNYGPGGGTGGFWENDVPNSQLSCNGLTYWSYHAAGVEIPRGSREQQEGAPVVTSTGSVADMFPGDIVCWDDTGRRTDIDNIRISYQHVAIYIGDGEIVEGTMPCAQRRHIVDNEYSYSITW